MKNPILDIQPMIVKSHEGKDHPCLVYKNALIMKHPLDLTDILKIIYDAEPTYLIETGTAYGGSALLYKDVLDNMDTSVSSYFTPKNKVISIDNGGHHKALEEKTPLNSYIDPNLIVYSQNITYFNGSSVDIGVVKTVRSLLEHHEVAVLVNLDSDHHENHVYQELKAYAELVTVGSYILVEDMLIEKVYPEHGPGPKGAVERFLKEDDRFVVDWSKHESYKESINFGGYLKRVK